MQIQGNEETGSTKRQFHLYGVPHIESRLYTTESELHLHVYKYL